MPPTQDRSGGATRALPLLVVLAAAPAAGCSAAWYTDAADRQVYSIVAAKQEQQFGEPRPFTIEPDRTVQAFFQEAAEATEAVEGGAPPELGPPPEAMEPAPPAPADALPGAVPGEAADGGPEAQGDEALDYAPVPAVVEDEASLAKDAPEGLAGPLPPAPPGTVRLTMAEALRLAVAANRDYQDQKEEVYLSALALTFERYLFQPQPFATGTVDLTNDQRARERRFDGSADVGFSQQLADGATIVASLGLTALKFINQELGDTVESVLAFSLRQPLWRGAGRRVVQENLIQTERNALYQVRTFARFEKTFAVQVAAEYLGVLEQRQVVLNEWRNYLSLREGRERAEWLAQAERLPEFQVDQARQDELAAYNRWISTREQYEAQLDRFKILLGIPVEGPVVLDPAELDRLAEAGLARHAETPEVAVSQALVTRLDLQTVRDGVEDAERKIVVAEDGLEGDVDLVASIGYDSDPARRQSARIEFNKGIYAIGLEIDLPIDRLEERNALRRTQISRERAVRAATLLEDQVTLQVRQAHRGLEEARQSYDIQRRSVELAERRVESTQLLLQAGRANQRDVLEAQRALVSARNALTRALVDHTITELEFRRDVGTLVVDAEGQIHDWSLTGE